MVSMHSSFHAILPSFEILLLDASRSADTWDRNSAHMTIQDGDGRTHLALGSFIPLGIATIDISHRISGIRLRRTMIVLLQVCVTARHVHMTGAIIAASLAVAAGLSFTFLRPAERSFCSFLLLLLRLCFGLLTLLCDGLQHKAVFTARLGDTKNAAMLV